MNFQPDETQTRIEVPFFEDARADLAPGYDLSVTETQLRSDILDLLARLGAADIQFQSGRFGGGQTGRPRYGYVIRFRVQGRPAQMQVAGLPLRMGDTELKRNKVRRQALYIVRAQLKAMLTAIVFSPGAAPLVQYVLVPGTERTVGEYVMTSAGLPNMNPQLPAQVVDVRGEVVEP